MLSSLSCVSLSYNLLEMERTDQPCRRKSFDFLGKNCAVSSQIVVEFRSAEIGVKGTNESPIGVLSIGVHGTAVHIGTASL